MNYKINKYSYIYLCGAGNTPMTKATSIIYKLTNNEISDGCSLGSIIRQTIDQKFDAINKKNSESYCTLAQLQEEKKDILNEINMSIYNSIWDMDTLRNLHIELKRLSTTLIDENEQTISNNVGYHRNVNKRITFFLSSVENQTADFILSYLLDNQYILLHNSIDKLLRSLLICNNKPIEDNDYDNLKKNYIKLFIIKYDDNAGMRCHIDKWNRTRGIIITTSIGPETIFYDMVPICKQKQAYRISIKNGQHVIMDGKARYDYYHCLPYGCDNKEKYTIGILLNLYPKIYNGTYYDAYYDTMLLNVSNITKCIDNTANDDIVQKPYIWTENIPPLLKDLFPTITPKYVPPHKREHKV